MSELPRGLAEYGWRPPLNFLGLPSEKTPDAPEVETSWEGSRFVVLPVPYESTTSYGRGTGEGPARILEASHHLELYDEELDAEPYEAGVCTLPAVDLPVSGPAEAVGELRRLYDTLLEKAGDRFVIAVGGEHSISSAPALAWHARLGDELSVLQFDAHTDLRESFQGSPWSHASVMRRVLEGGVSRIVAVGIRSLTRQERALTREREGITVVFAEELRSSGWIEKALAGLGDRVYLTFDVDFFDPSVVPATGTPEPGGGSWWQALDLLRAVFREKDVVGADVVEFAGQAGSPSSAVVAAKLVYKLIGYRSLLRARPG